MVPVTRGRPPEVIKSELNSKDEEAFPDRHKNGKAEERRGANSEKHSEGRRAGMAKGRWEHTAAGVGGGASV